MKKDKREELGHIIDLVFQEAREKILEDVLDDNDKCKWTKPENIKEGENSETKRTATFYELRDSFFAVLYINQLTEMSKLQKEKGEEKGDLDLVAKSAEHMRENKGFRITMTVNGTPFDPEAFFDRLQLGYESLIAKEATRIVSELIGKRLDDLVSSLDSFKNEFEHMVHLKLNEMRELNEAND